MRWLFWPYCSYTIRFLLFYSINLNKYMPLRITTEGQMGLKMWPNWRWKPWSRCLFLIYAPIFQRKKFSKKDFPSFPMFGSIKKYGVWKTQGDQQKTKIKISLIFLSLFFTFIFRKTNSKNVYDFSSRSRLNLKLICKLSHYFLSLSLSKQF